MSLFFRPLSRPPHGLYWKRELMVIGTFANTFEQTFKATRFNQFLLKLKLVFNLLLLNSFSFSVGYEFRRRISPQFII